METLVQIKSDDKFHRIILPIVLSVFAVYITIGMAIGILPGYLQNTLGFNSSVIGIVIGAQSLATLCTRAFSGKFTDTRGAKDSTNAGVVLIVVAGGTYLSATFLHANPFISLSLLLIARMIHGAAESMLVTGALTLGIGLAGMHQSGKVMTWNGIAMYSGIALGAPLGIWLDAHLGIRCAFSSFLLLSVFSWGVILKLPSTAAHATHSRTPFYKVIGKIAPQGLALAFSSIGFACIASFIALYFAEQRWGSAPLGFFYFGAAYVSIRVFFSSFPDKYGGYKVALVSFLIEIIGQLCIAFSAGSAMAIVGCALTGAGFSLVFPALGVLAVKKLAPQMRGTALAAYAAFFDLALGIAAPVAGLIAGWSGYRCVYIFGGVSCLLAVLALLAGQKKPSGSKSSD